MADHAAETLALCDLIGELIDGVSEFSDTFAERAAGLAVTYPGAPDAHPLTGTRAPDLRWDTTGLFTLLRPGRPVLLDLAGEVEQDELARPGPTLHSGPPSRPTPPGTTSPRPSCAPTGTWPGSPRSPTSRPRLEPPSRPERSRYGRTRRGPLARHDRDRAPAPCRAVTGPLWPGR
ncbi:hypothetical protein [Kitasatospora sp. NPDC058190]|uniref:hypothetical protein n=1 Tax=Kitasatospora sp. NPDC058190 TaxID=3346371 RepID=UPI0036DF8598